MTRERTLCEADYGPSNPWLELIYSHHPWAYPALRVLELCALNANDPYDACFERDDSAQCRDLPGGPQLTILSALALYGMGYNRNRRRKPQFQPQPLSAAVGMRELPQELSVSSAGSSKCGMMQHNVKGPVSHTRRTMGRDSGLLKR